MTRSSILIAVTLVLAVGCGSAGDDDAASTTAPATSDAAHRPETSVTAMSIPEVAPSSGTASDTETPDPLAGTIIMLKLHVGDIDDAEAFYGTVFGASLAYDLGDQIRVLTFPDGPGLILLGEGVDEDNDHGSFLMQVADLQATQALAVANGATAAEAFEGTPGGEQARSVRLFDPWGNGIEILQLG